MCSSFRGTSDVWYSSCRNRARVDVRLSVSVAVGVSSNKVRVVIVLTKNVVKIISLVLQAVLTNVKDKDKPDYVHLDDQTQPTFEMTPGFKPFTVS